MSWTVGILIMSWLCIFSVSEATLGESCIVTENCTATVEICTDGNCECNSGYFNVSDVCKLSSITVSLSAQSPSVVYGSEVVLTASITSEVPLNLSNTIKWLKGQTGGSLTEFELTQSKYIQNDVSPGQVTLTIKNVSFEDTRAYQVKVGNIAGVTSNSNQVSLTVTGEKPTVTLPETITETDTTVTIDCTVSVAQSSPTVTVYWLFNGQNLEISNSAKYSGGTVNTPSLTIKNIASTDAGVYHCGARNLLGSSNSSKSVTLEKPTVTLLGTTTETDTTVTIDCTVSVAQSSPTVTVYWLFNGQNLEISNSAKYSGGTVNTPSLTIKNIASTDAGEYHCGARNLLGSSTSSLSVTLAAPTVVTISKQPAGPVNYNSSVTFNGLYTSNLLNVSLIKWQKLTGGNFINIDITGNKYTGSSVTGPSPQLKINPVQLIDETSYRLEVSNGVGSSSSNNISLNVIGGNLTVTTGADVTGRFGGSVTIGCTVTGLDVNKIQWKRHINNNPEDISIDNQKFTGGSVDTKALTINNLTNSDALYQYQCTASNPRGVFKSATTATVTVKYGQFNENCSDSEPCDTSKLLTCMIRKCLCVNTHYHKDKVCYPKTGLAPTTIFLNSTTDMFFVSWNHPTTHYELVSGYEVVWRFLGGSSTSSGPLERNVNHYTASNGLMSGQLYTVVVNSEVTLTNPAESTVVASPDTKVRTVPSAPGPVIPTHSSFAHNNLIINWTVPVNTVVTKYEVTLDGTTYTTMSSDATYQFTGKVFVPGKRYAISIVTISGTTSDIVKRSSEHMESIRTTPTKPGTPTYLQCPQSPLDVSLEISWTAPTEPNGLIVKYQIDVSPGNLGQIYTTSNETHKNVGGLSPEQMYTFIVRTINDAVDNTSEPSSSLTCKTKAGVSSAPTNLKVDEIKSRGLRINFNKPDNVSGILAAYKIVISEGGKCVQQILIHGIGICSTCDNKVGCQLINYTVPNITNNNISYTASGLNPYTIYMVKVVAINGKGEGHPVNETVTTDEEVPPQPEQINVSNYQSTSLLLSWTLPDPSPGNTTYTIYTHEGNDDKGTSFLMKKSTKVYGFGRKTLLVTGLEEYWPYKFKVTAATVKGDNTSDFSSVFRTTQAAPGQVLNLYVQRRGSDYKSAYVSWSPPALKDHNGVLKSYLFSVNHTGTVEEEEIPVTSTQDTVEKKIIVIPETVYIIEVVLQNNENMTSKRSTQSYEAPAGPPPVTNIKPITTTQEEHKPTTYTIPLNINTTYFKIDENGKQVFGGIAVCAESKYNDMGKTTIRSVWESLPNWHKAKMEEFPLYRATNDTFLDTARTENSRKKRSTGASTLPFIIGEDITCSSLNEDVYCNGPLNPGTSYIVIIFACTSGGCTYYKTDEPFITAKIEEPQDIPIGLIAGVVVAVVVVVVIVGVAFVVVKRRNRLGETKQYTKGIDNPTSLDEPVPKNIPRKRPIKLKELSDKVAEKHKDSNLHFAREYEDLKALSPKHPAETSELDNNKLKNRYVNILPFDHSRVKLMLTEDDDPSTDFINANYLPGYKSQREYIATQGPIPGTIDDFWRMIWEQNVSIIVMLTLCKEEGRVKCEMYWPENIHEPKQYGDLVVETVSNSTVNFYEFRIFKIKLGDTTRSVKHFHFLQWKDFSANVQNDVMIDFIKNVRNHIRPPDMNGPVVVHCSAGVGRTGTYCALDHLFQFVDEHDLDESIDIFDLVMNLRERRMFMVQTEQQYIFIHDCLKDYLEKKLAKDECLYENQAFVADDEPVEESLYQNYSNQRTDL